MRTGCMKKIILLVLLSLALFVGSSSVLFAAKKPSAKDTSPFIGKWVFHSIMNNVEFLTAEELLEYVPNNVDKNDPEAMQEVRRNKKLFIDSVVEISTDGNLYMLTHIPEDISKQEIDEAVRNGTITLRDGMMMLDKPAPWQDRNGELWVQVGIETKPDGKQQPSWKKYELVDGLLTLDILRYQKAE